MSLFNFFTKKKNQTKNKLIELQKKVHKLNYKEKEVAVSLSDFFEENKELGSIGCNLEDVLEPRFFYNCLKKLEQKPDVESILIRITDMEEGEWPFSDTIYVISSMNTEQLYKELESLEPTEINNEWMYGLPETESPIRKGKYVHSIWWD